MLREDVAEACREGKFSIHAVESIQEALALMTGHEVGKIEEDRNYTEDSLLSHAVEKAHQFWKLTLASPKRLTSTEEGVEGFEEGALPSQSPVDQRDDL